MRDARIARFVISAPWREPQANRAVQAVCFLPYLAKTFAESRAEQPAPGQVIPTIVKQESIRRDTTPGNKLLVPFVHPPQHSLLGVRGKEADIHPTVVV